MVAKNNNHEQGDPFDSPELMTAALSEGVRCALLRHKRLGQPVVVWRDGKVVWLKPEEIEVSEVPETPPAGQ